MAKRILIMGAGGRDFHVFNTCYRHDRNCRVVAFTAAQIPHIESRSYPPELAGPGYPEGIPVFSEDRLTELIQKERVDEVIFCYSDVRNEYVAEKAAQVEAAGARFRTFDPESCLIRVSRPCIAVCAVRTGCGKSPLSRYLVSMLNGFGLRTGVIRHPMPYGNLKQQVVQRFARVEDLEAQHCTIEEMEEYEPHIRAGSVVFAGADYRKIVAAAQAECDVLLWDGGNNDAPFVRPDLLITILDPLRAGDEVGYFPSRWNLEHADVLVIGKYDQATEAEIAALEASIRSHNARAEVVQASLAIRLEQPDSLQGQRVLVVEDGPTTTHGGMAWGAGYLAATRAGAEIVDPRPYAVGAIAEAYRKFPHLGNVVPALGYSASQLEDLRNTIENAPCDRVIVATPIDLSRVLSFNRPATRVAYRFEPRDPAALRSILGRKLGITG